jgi:hypothetical protein
MADQDLTILENVKTWLPISTTNNADDGSLMRLITAVSMDFMRATRRPDLLLADYTEVHQGDGGTRLVLFHWPIASIDTLTIGGVTIPKSADKVAAGFYVDQDIDPERVWQIYLNGYTFLDGAAVQAGYSAGYVQPGQGLQGGQIALPADIEQAVIDWIGYRYKGRPNVGVTMRKSSEGESVQPEQVDAPPNVLQVIERYRRELPSVDRRGDDRAERMTRAGARALRQR